MGGGIFLVWWQFDKMTPDQTEKFMSAIKHADYWILLPVVVMSLASHLSRSVRWKILMEPMGYKPSLFNAFGATMVGYLANSFVPRLGEILKCTLLTKYEKIPTQKLIGTIVVERLFDFLCYLMFIVITVIIQYQLVGNFVQDKLHSIVNGSGMALWLKAMLYLAGLVVIILLVRWSLKKYAHVPIIKKISHFGSGLKEGISSIRNLQKRKWFLFHTVFIWTMYLLQIYVGFRSIAEVSHLGIDAACAVLTLATLAMIVTPGGLGTFPTAVFLVLQLYKIDSSIGEAFGWLMWGTTTFIILFFGSIFFGLLVLVNRKKDTIPATLTTV